jgi:hypothetical protein
VAAYDRLGNTVTVLAKIHSAISAQRVYRTLDNVPVVTPNGSDEGVRFAAAYKDLCKQLNIALAQTCPKAE